MPHLLRAPLKETSKDGLTSLQLAHHTYPHYTEDTKQRLNDVDIKICKVGWLVSALWDVGDHVDQSIREVRVQASPQFRRLEKTALSTSTHHRREIWGPGIFNVPQALSSKISKSSSRVSYTHMDIEILF